MIYIPCIKLSPEITISMYCTGSLPHIQRSVSHKYAVHMTVLVPAERGGGGSGGDDGA